MITLSIVAAGIIALAAALLARPSPEPRASDQRGITLQTLIVTAVLVLMAVAAGVVIVAITNTQEDRLRVAGNSTAGDSKCEPWEIYDITVASAGRGGGFGGIGSSDKGCIRVCYIRATTMNSNFAAADRITDGTTDHNTNLELVFSRSNIANNNTAGTNTTNVLVVTDTNELAASNTIKDPNSGESPAIATVVLDTLQIIEAGESTVAASADQDYNDEQMTIRVSVNQQYCEIVDAQGDELLRSVEA